MKPSNTTRYLGAKILHRLNHGEGKPCQECYDNADKVLAEMYRGAQQ